MSRMNFLSSCPSRVTSRRNSRLNRRRRRRAYCCSSNKIIRKSDIIFLKSQKQFLAQMFRNIFLCLSLFIFPFRCRNSKSAEKRERVYETIDGRGPGGADIGGSGATDELEELADDVDAREVENDVMEQFPLLLLVHGAIEFGGIEPRPIIPSWGPPIEWGPPIPWGIMPGGGGPPPFRCIGWWPFMWW